MARKLKVFRAELDGLHEWIVAAPNRRAALDAFGVRQDLFAQGEADEETDAAIAEQARAQPGVPLRRTKGSKDAFAPVDGLGDWSAAVPKGRKKADAPRRDDARLKKAQAALKALETDHREAMDAIQQQRSALDDREADEVERYRQQREKAEAAIKAARA